MSESAVCVAGGLNAGIGLQVVSGIRELEIHRATISFAIAASKRRVFCAKLIGRWINASAGEKLRETERLQ